MRYAFGGVRWKVALTRCIRAGTTARNAVSIDRGAVGSFFFYSGAATPRTLPSSPPRLRSVVGWGGGGGGGGKGGRFFNYGHVDVELLITRKPKSILWISTLRGSQLEGPHTGRGANQL